MTSLTQSIDNAILGLIKDLVEKGEYSTASLAINKLETQQSLNKALVMLGGRLHIEKLKDSTTRRCLNTLVSYETRLLHQIVDIVRVEPEAMTIGEKVLQLLMSHGLANAEPDIKIEDVELKQFNF